MMRAVFSVDVEDWFHILDVKSAPVMSDWDRLPSRVEQNFSTLLDIFAEHGVRTTCFFLGWVARKFPHLVRSAVSAGHEPASHGYAHQLVYSMESAAFRHDARMSREVIEDAAGRAVLGYRAPGFSVTDRTPWFFDTLAEAGYCYDASVFPARRAHGGMPGAHSTPHSVGNLVEFPVSVNSVLGRQICFFGGGYLRLFPCALIESMAATVAGAGVPVNFYIHPREIDPDHPRLEMGLLRLFKTYVNLQSTEPKIRRLLSKFEFITFSDLYARYTSERLAKAAAI